MNSISTVRHDLASGVLSLRVLHSSYLRELPLRYVASEGLAWLLAPAEPSPAWASVLMEANPSLYWRIDDKHYLGVARTISDPRELASVRRRFEAVFGEATVRRWYGSNLHGFVLEPLGTDRIDYAILVERYFDALSEGYDRVVQENPFDSRLRELTGVILSSAFKSGELVLEIGAGTGLETLPLARRGIHVVATDISQSMLEKLSKKARDEGLDGLVTTRRLRAADLSSILQEFGPASFDGAFSDFGALNCEPVLGGIPAVIAQLLRGRGRVILAVWNRVCLFEIIAFLVTARPRRAFSRFLDPVPVGSSRFGVPVFAQSVSKFVRVFSPYFRLERTVGLPVFLPPYDFASRAVRYQGLISILESVDKRLAGHAPFSRLGDHFVMELRKK